MLMNLNDCILCCCFSYALEVVETDGYKHLLKNHSHLVTDAFRTLARSCSNNANVAPRKKKAKLS